MGPAPCTLIKPELSPLALHFLSYTHNNSRHAVIVSVTGQAGVVRVPNHMIQHILHKSPFMYKAHLNVDLLQ